MLRRRVCAAKEIVLRGRVGAVFQLERGLTRTLHSAVAIRKAILDTATSTESGLPLGKAVCRCRGRGGGGEEEVVVVVVVE